MASLRERFGSHENALWKQLCDELGGKLTDRQGHRQDKVVAKVGPWVITLDEHSEPGYRANTSTPACGPPSSIPKALRFAVSHQTVFSNIGRLVGLQDINVDHDPFDKMFRIQGSDPQDHQGPVRRRSPARADQIRI